MKDTGMCPHCERDFAVTRYGWGLRCPRCRGRINVFPDPRVFIHTRIGVFGVGLAKTENIPKVEEMKLLRGEHEKPWLISTNKVGIASKSWSLGGLKLLKLLRRHIDLLIR